MCPACISTVTWAFVGATSTGGLAALVAARFLAKGRPKRSARSAADAALREEDPEAQLPDPLRA